MAEVKISAKTLKNMSSNGMFVRRGFTWKKALANVWEVFKREEYAVGEGEEDNNFRLVLKSQHGKIKLPGFLFINALLVPKDETGAAVEIKEEQVSDIATKVWYEDEIETLLSKTEVLNDLVEEGKSFTVPEKINILGVVVRRDPETKKPAMPLRHFQGYQAAVKYYQEREGNDDAYPTKEEFLAILQLEGDARPVTLDKELRSLELRNGIDPDHPKFWRYQLLIEDWNEKE